VRGARRKDQTTKRTKDTKIFVRLARFVVSSFFARFARIGARLWGLGRPQALRVIGRKRGSASTLASQARTFG